MVRDADVPPLAPRWPAGAPSAPPAPGEVQLWLADLDRPPVALDRLAATLDAAERERAARFHFEVHRRRFTAGRGLLRRLLGELLGVAPEALVFAYGEKGKPRLVAGAAGLREGPRSLSGSELETGLRFNLSHSANGALLAVARGRELGVDLEALRPMDDAEALVERFFHPAERRVFAGLEADRRLAAFFSGWTRKEAYLKARGDGLSLPTTEFEVALAPGGPEGLIGFEREPQEVGRWSFAAFEPAQGFLGAVAVEGPPPELRERFWTG
ncbi:MAG TPA: 4'-phosphopantetheinyl transferase superfamily protein [Thermoanaerobaculia bacterium]|nr:4'-phosphopantetheinyl transferase superfamily protein [Thermoanaerobaculia bacterium]